MTEHATERAPASSLEAESGGLGQEQGEQAGRRDDEQDEQRVEGPVTVDATHVEEGGDAASCCVVALDELPAAHRRGGTDHADDRRPRRRAA